MDERLDGLGVGGAGAQLAQLGLQAGVSRDVNIGWEIGHRDCLTGSCYWYCYCGVRWDSDVVLTVEERAGAASGLFESGKL